MSLKSEQSAPYSAVEMLHCCERWFAMHSPTARCADGIDRIHPMLESIRLTIQTDGEYSITAFDESIQLIQSRLIAHNADYDAWNQLTDHQKDQRIRGAKNAMS